MEDEEDGEKRCSDSGLGSSGLGMSPSRDLGMFSDDEFVEEEPRVCWPLSVLRKPERLADQNKYACDVCRPYTEAVRATQYLGSLRPRRPHWARVGGGALLWRSWKSVWRRRPGRRRRPACVEIDQ